MQFKALILSAIVSLVAAQGSVCFDAGDCILSGGGQCVKASGQLLGSCSKSGATTLATASASGSAPAATGSVCFDDGDCILSGGKCVKAAGQLILGNCVKN